MTDDPYKPHWPDGLEPDTGYRVPCDDKGQGGHCWLGIMVSGTDGDVYVSMQDWERFPKGDASPFPSIRIRTLAEGGRNLRTRQALLLLANAMRLDAKEHKR